jgi:DNA-binding MarR family transcriptional regulator/N-acetylglutamate synthase-like GNAT family acetyltransferase
MARTTKQSRQDNRDAAVRAFNRFYPLQVGLLSPGYLHSPFSITEARVIYDIATRSSAEVAGLRRDLGLDPGYLSRMLNRFEEDGLIARERSSADRRRQLVRLTAKGRRTFAGLDRRSSAEIGGILSPHSDEQQARLVEAMGSIRRILGEPLDERRAEIREIRPGDHGWVLERHAHLYDDELGWPPQFEALVARIVADYLTEHDPKRERGWIGELDGERAGAVYCVRKSDEVAQLRLLFVEDWARGFGIGRKLVDRCIRFARSKGYVRMLLWTNSSLDSARRIYDAAGFTQASEAPNEVFPKGTVGQELWLDL